MNCKPHLRHLPAETAVELQTLRSKLEMERPPFRPIQMDLLPEPTVPTFAKVANKPKVPALKPREKWMRDTPPFMSDAEADETYSAACAWLFGTEEPTHGPAHSRDHRHPLHPQHLETLRFPTQIHPLAGPKPNIVPQDVSYPERKRSRRVRLRGPVLGHQP
jgi:hypothetical protein